MYKYSDKNAQTYSKLGIKGTTYEPGFNEAQKLLGDLTGKQVLDFGSGTGRTSQLLLSIGAEKVVGVDHNQSMIDQANKLNDNRLEFIKIDDELPFADGTFDAALCAHVFVEVSSLEEMKQICSEILQVLKKDGVFVVITNNSDAIGHEYLSYGYEKQPNLESGDKITCTIKKGEDSFEIDDYYWTEEDIQSSLRHSGFKINSVTFPTIQGEGWLEETKVAPHVVIKAVKKIY